MFPTWKFQVTMGLEDLGDLVLASYEVVPCIPLLLEQVIPLHFIVKITISSKLLYRVQLQYWLKQRSLFTEWKSSSVGYNLLLASTLHQLSQQFRNVAKKCHGEYWQECHGGTPEADEIHDEAVGCRPNEGSQQIRRIPHCCWVLKWSFWSITTRFRCTWYDDVCVFIITISFCKCLYQLEYLKDWKVA